MDNLYIVWSALHLFTGNVAMLYTMWNDLLLALKALKAEAWLAGCLWVNNTLYYYVFTYMYI